MKNEEYFQLTLEQRIAREKAFSIHNPRKQTNIEYTLEDYYNTGDTSSFLEQLRAYQLSEILGKYKLF